MAHGPISNEKTAMIVSRNTIIVNIILSAGKLYAGIWGRSAAMISDAIHSASDVVSTVIVMIGVKCANRESDEKHPYGHERMECIAAVVLGVILLLTGVGIAKSGIESIIHLQDKPIAVPKAIALVAAIVSIVVKELMYWYTKIAATRIRSDALHADAWHHRSDALSSVGSMIGILAAKMGFPMGDPIACIIISALIIKVAIDIVIDSFRKMIDESCEHKIVEDMRLTVLVQEGVKAIDEIKTRKFGSRIYVDIDIAVDGMINLFEAHMIAERVHHMVEKGYPDVKHCMVHVNPFLEPDDRE